MASTAQGHSYPYPKRIFAMKRPDTRTPNGAKEMTPSTRPDPANDLNRVRQDIDRRSAEHQKSLGKTNGAKGGNI